MSIIVIGGVDIETTGLSQADGHRIIEFACQLYRYDTTLGTETPAGSYVTRVNPGRSIDPAAQAVHGISFEALTGEPRWEEIAPKVAKVMNACHILVAHNGHGFDFPFIANELLRAGLSVPAAGSIDTMLDGRWATPLGKLPNLGELAFACDIPYDKSKAHAALYDVQVMMDSFFKALKQGFYTIPRELYMGAAA